MLIPVTALFVMKRSIYKSLNVSCYDIDRDARTFDMSTPVVAHPPCRSWGRLRKFAKPLDGESELAVMAVNIVRRCGGVLEHPDGSILFEQLNMKKSSSSDVYGGFFLSVYQFWWGHKARKKTILYICGCSMSDLPAFPLRFDAIQYVVSGSKKGGKKEISKADRERTPIGFARWLIEVAMMCKPNQDFFYNKIL